MRSTIALTLAGLALAAAGTSTASAAPPSKAARFETSITMTQTAKYDEPHHYGFEDCYHRYWTSAKAQETWKVRTRPRVVGVSRGPAGAYLDYGGQIDISDPASLIPGLSATSTVTRSSARESGSDPGACGSGSGDIDPAPLVSDCGTLSFDGFVSLDFAKGRVTPKLLPHPNETRRDSFSDCILLTPKAARVGFNEASQSFPLADLLDPEQRLHVVLGRKTFTQRDDDATRTLTVRWELRMKRVGR